MSISPEKMPRLRAVLGTCSESPPPSLHKELGESTLNISIKDEPLDLIEYSLNEANVKDQPEDLGVNDLEASPGNNGEDISASAPKNNATLENTRNNTSGSPTKICGPVTRKVIINGQERTCILVNSPELKQSIMDSTDKSRKTAVSPSHNHPRSSKNISKSIVQCSRCGSNVHLDNFRQHIDFCPPRRSGSKTTSSVQKDAGQNQTVQVMYNPCTGEIVAMGNNNAKTIFQTPNGTAAESSFASSTAKPKLLNKTSHLENLQCPQSNNNDYLPSHSLIHRSDYFMKNSNLKGVPTSIPISRLPRHAAQNLNNKLNTIYPEKSIFQCSKCDFRSTTLIVMNIHMKKHKPTTSNFSSTSERSGTQNNNTSTKGNAESSKDNSESDRMIKVVTVWKRVTQKTIEDALAVSNSRPNTTNIDDSRCNSVIDKDVSNHPIEPSTSKALTLNIDEDRNNTNSKCNDGQTSSNVLNNPVKSSTNKSNEERNNTNAKHGRGGNYTQNSSAEGKNEPIEIKRITENLKDPVIVLTRCNVGPTFENKTLHNLQVTVSSRRTRSKSVCERKFVEIPDEAAGQVSSRRARSKSVCARKFPEVRDQSPTQVSSIRSESVCARKFCEVEESLAQASSRRARSRSVCARKYTEITDESSGDISSRKTRSKSVCARKFTEITDGVSEHSMRTRSKSVSANKADMVTNLVSDISPKLTRSKSTCRDKFISDQNSRDFKTFQSVPSRNKQNTKPGGNREPRIENPKEDIGVNNLSDGELRKEPMSRSRNRAVTEICNNSYPGISDQNKLPENVSDTNLTNPKKLHSKGVEINRNVPKINNNASISGKSNFKSVFENVIDTSGNQNSPAPQDSEKLVDNLLLLNDSTFSCSICSFTTDRRSRLKDHERNHRKTQLPIFSCVYCGQKYTRYMLYLHVQNVHPGQKFQIQDDSEKTNSKLLYKCSDCSFKTINLTKFKFHIKKHTSETAKVSDVSKPKPLTVDQEQSKHSFEPVRCIDTEGRQYFKCQICSYNGSRSSDIKTHMKCHKNNPIIQCIKCDFKSTPTALWYHMRKCGEKSKSNQAKIGAVQTKPKVLFKCHECSFSTSLRIKLKLHIRSCHLKTRDVTKNVSDVPALLMNCSRCAFSATSRTEWENHRKKCLALTENEFKCNHCSYIGASKGFYTRHIKCHEKNAPLKKCRSCNFKSTFKVVRKHMREANHMMEKKVLKCKLCSLTCSRPSALISHVRSHRLKPPIKKCPHCSFRSTPEPLRQHKCTNKEVTKCVDSNITMSVSSQTGSEKIKTNKPSSNTEKPMFRCPSCPFSTCLRIKLNFHGKKYHEKLNIKHISKDEKHYPCNVCSYVSSKRKNLTRHINTHLIWNLPIRKCDNCDYKSTKVALRCHSIKCNRKRVQNSKNNTIIAATEMVFEKPFRSVRAKASDSDIENSQDLTQNTSKSNKIEKSSIVKASKNIVDGTKNSSEINKVDRLRQAASNNDRELRSVDGYFSCTECSYTSRNKTDTRKHILQHQWHATKQCSNCSYRSTLKALSAHMRRCVVSNKQSNSEKDVSRTTISETHAKIIQKSHSQDLTQNQSKSNKIKKSSIVKTSKNIEGVTKNSSEINRVGHLRQAASNSDRELRLVDGYFSCTDCSYTSRNKTDTRKHILQHQWHATKQCSNCSYRSTPNALFAHVRRCVVSSKQSNSEKDVSRTKIFESHTKIVQKPDEDNQLTQKVDEEKNPPQQKADKDTSPKSFKCKYCSFTSFWEYLIERHMYSHTDLDLPIEQCENCDFRSTPVALTAHKNNSCSGKSQANNFVSEKLKLSKSDASYSTETNTSQEKISRKRKRQVKSKNKSKNELQGVLGISPASDAMNTLDNTLDHTNIFSTEVLKNTHKEATTQEELNERQVGRDNISRNSSNSSSSVTTFCCPKCSFTTLLRIKLQSHLKRNHPLNTTTKTVSLAKCDRDLEQCKYCSFIGPRWRVKRHERCHIILKQSVNKCEKCDFRSTQNALAHHRKKCLELMQ